MTPTSQPLYENLPATNPADVPMIKFFPAHDPDGSAILICPGGGYARVVSELEGDPVAEFFNKFGISAAVLRYRVAPHRHPEPLEDCVRGMRLLRTGALSSEVKIDPKRVGVMGFSAGGHLAATLSTHFEKDTRPDVSILCYPVITFVESCAHAGSRRNLLGDKPDPELLQQLSAEKRVSGDTPPAFLFHTVDDPGVKVENSLLYAAALRDHRIPHEMHLYEHGPHGVGMAVNTGGRHRDDPVLATWPGLCVNWLKTHGFGRGLRQS
jgi:acetyl esterase/lipase